MEENKIVKEKGINQSKNRTFCEKCNMPLTGFDLNYGKKINSQSCTCVYCGVKSIPKAEKPRFLKPFLKCLAKRFLPSLFILAIAGYALLHYFAEANGIVISEAMENRLTPIFGVPAIIGLIFCGLLTFLGGSDSFNDAIINTWASDGVWSKSEIVERADGYSKYVVHEEEQVGGWIIAILLIILKFLYYLLLSPIIFVFRVFLMIIFYIVGMIKYQNTESAKVKRAFKKTYKTYPRFIVIDNPQKAVYDKKITKEINKQIKNMSLSKAKEKAIEKYGNGEMFKEICFLGKNKYYPLVKYFDSFVYKDKELLKEIKEIQSKCSYENINKKAKRSFNKVLKKLTALNSSYTVTECYYVCVRLVNRKLDLKLIKVINSFYDKTMIGEELSENISYESIINEDMWVNMSPFAKEKFSDEFLMNYLSKLN